MNGTQWQLENDYHNYTISDLKTPEMDGYADSGNDCTAEPKLKSLAPQYYITSEAPANTVSQYQLQAYNVTKDWQLPSQWQVSWDNLRYEAESQDPQYARDTSLQWCDQHITELERGVTKELYTGYDMWGPDVKCSYFIRSGSYDQSNHVHGAPTFRIKDVHTGAAYNPEVWDFDLHYIDYDDNDITYEDDDEHYEFNIPTYTYTYCKDEIKNYHRFYSVLGSIVKSNAGAINLYTGLNDRSVDRTAGGYLANDQSTWVRFQTDEENDDDDWTDSNGDDVADTAPVYEGPDGYCDEFIGADGHDDCQDGGDCTVDPRNTNASSVGKFYNIRPWSGSVTPTYTSWDGIGNPTTGVKKNPIYRKSGLSANDAIQNRYTFTEEDGTDIEIDYISDETTDLGTEF